MSSQVWLKISKNPKKEKNWQTFNFCYLRCFTMDQWNSIVITYFCLPRIGAFSHLSIFNFCKARKFFSHTHIRSLGRLSDLRSNYKNSVKLYYRIWWLMWFCRVKRCLSNPVFRISFHFEIVEISSLTFSHVLICEYTRESKDPCCIIYMPDFNEISPLGSPMWNTKTLIISAWRLLTFSRYSKFSDWVFVWYSI